MDSANLKNQHVDLISFFTWDEVKSEVQKLQPQLANIINEWNPGKKYKLIKVKYPYGINILDNGSLSLPDEAGNFVPIQSQKISQQLKKALSYSNLPYGLILNKGCEVYADIDERIVSLAFFKPGVILGLWESLEGISSHFPRKIWQVSSGSRYAFLLPKISEDLSHDKIKKHLGIRLSAPKALTKQQRIFREISKKTNKSCWYTEILFFTENWFHEHDTKIWHQFDKVFLKAGWDLAEYNRNEITNAIVWQLFSRLLSKRGIKPDSYTFSTFKHIIAIAVGAKPGFKPALEDELSLPTSTIQKVYTDIYGLKYSPIIMYADHFEPDTNYDDMVLYSPKAPTLIDTIPKSKNLTSYIEVLRDLKELWEYFIDDALDGKLKIEETKLRSVVDNVSMNFYHSNVDPHNNILSVNNLISETPVFQEEVNKSRQKKLAESSAFFKGCIKIKSLCQNKE